MLSATRRGESRLGNLTVIINLNIEVHLFFKERWGKEDDLLQRFVVTFSIKHMLYQRRLGEMQFKRLLIW